MITHIHPKSSDTVWLKLSEKSGWSTDMKLYMTWRQPLICP